MLDLSKQRCQFHPLREAVARCPECQRFFCRECVTEHDDRLICASCLRKMATTTESRRKSWRALLGVTGCLAGVFTAWVFFYLIGQGLLRVPSSFHEGTLWTKPLLDTEDEK